MRVPEFLISSLLLSLGWGINAAHAQSLPDSPQPRTNEFLDSIKDPYGYTRPSEKTLTRVYTFDLAGPYPVLIAASTAAIHQGQDSPSAWGQGAAGYARRFGSSLGIGAVSTTTRYVLAQSIREDTLYYECACERFGPRLRHAVISSFTGRRGRDGHRVFSIPSLVAPYAGTFTATYAWYPHGYGLADALRMGSYGLLGYMAGNISLEFIYGGPHSLLARAHLPIPTNTAPRDPPP